MDDQESSKINENEVDTNEVTSEVTNEVTNDATQEHDETKDIAGSNEAQVENSENFTLTTNESKQESTIPLSEEKGDESHAAETSNDGKENETETAIESEDKPSMENNNNFEDHLEQDKTEDIQDDELKDEIVDSEMKEDEQEIQENKDDQNEIDDLKALDQEPEENSQVEIAKIDSEEGNKVEEKEDSRIEDNLRTDIDVVNESTLLGETIEQNETDDNVDKITKEVSFLQENQSAISTDSIFAKKEYARLPILVETKKSISTLTPVYCFGFNQHVPIINLSNENSRFVFYACSHLAVMYDYIHNESMILQGHCNTITCTAASRDKRWLVSGDQGSENSVVIVWDASTGFPVRTMFEPHPMGVLAVALTPDARYLATISAEHTQTFAIWDWTNGEDNPLCSASLSTQFGIQNYISFLEDDTSIVATNSDSQVLFFQWDKIGNLKYFAPSLTKSDFNKTIGKFCGTVFLPKTTKAVSATSQGILVVWDSNIVPSKVNTENVPDKKAIKLVPITQKAILVITLIDGHIVTGNKDGEVMFFDFDFKLVYWYKDWNFGGITSISASGAPGFKEKKEIEEKCNYPTEATIKKDKFIVRDFIVGTNTTIFATLDVEKSDIKVIIRDHDSSVFAIQAHPSMPLVATGSYSGMLLIWDYEKKHTIKCRHFKGSWIKSLCYDHKGLLLAIGFTNGTLRILDSFGLKDVVEPFNYSKTHVSIIRFSEDSKLLATVNDDNTTTLYSNDEKAGWKYVARYRAHYKKIVDMMFGRFFDTNNPRLFTLGEDRRLVEYDLVNTTVDNLKILQEIRVEQSSIPLSMCWYPEVNSEGFFVVANDDYKLKMFNHQTKMCRYTFLGPTFGSPINILRPVPEGVNHPSIDSGNGPVKQRYMVYANYDKIGLIRLPLNGDPYNYMTMIAHPRGVTNFTVSHDGEYLISVGEDSIVTIWKIDVSHLEARATSISDSMSPYYELIEGGEFGEFMHEVKNYFYYSMIRMQGIDSLETRKVDVSIEIKDVPFIMRAIGFYPSEEEIENMLNELKFRNYYKTGVCETHANLNTFLKMYVNHRPPFGISASRIQEAFRVIEKCQGELTMEKFTNLLLSSGEPFKEDELIEHLATLLGFNDIGGNLELEEFKVEESISKKITEALPKQINYQNFIENILSMKIKDDAGEDELRNKGYQHHIEETSCMESLNKLDNTEKSSQTN